MGKTTDIRPPHAPEIEAAVLGAMMLDREAVDKAIPIINPDVFYSPENRLIYDAMMVLYNQEKPIDTVTLYEELKKQGRVEKVGGAVYISKLYERVSSAANVEHHCKILYEKHLLRSLIKIGAVIQGEAQSAQEDTFDIIENAEKALYELTQFDSKNYYHISDVAKKYSEKISRGMSAVIKTGFYDLDSMLRIENGNLITLAARPSMGKSSLALCIARNVQEKIPVGIFSLEMTADSLITRNLSIETGLTYGEVCRSGKERLDSHLSKISNFNILIDDSSSLNLSNLRSKARRMKREYGVGMIIIDYLQHMNEKAESREREISKLSNGTKSLAKDLDIPIILLSQLNRAVETRVDKRPGLADLRDSGSIEQDSDAVVFLYRPEYYKIMQDENGFSTENRAELIIAKQRNGAVGSEYLYFKKETAEFRNLTASYYENA
jgi:replicative DNA helicase